MLNPKSTETMIDTACGSCGFPMHTIFYVWKQLNPKTYNLFTTRTRTADEFEYAINKIVGIDFSEKSVRVSRMLNIIAGDGQTNVVELNTLDYTNWKKSYQNEKWRERYNKGFVKLSNMSANPMANNDNEKFKSFNFDILMANPPFACDINNKEQLEIYDLSYNSNEELKKKIGRDILFIERNLNFLKPGGRMAIVLPQGIFNNTNDEYLRNYIADKCRILAVIGLHENTFKPHTAPKTNILFIQKWTDEKCGFPNICPKLSNNDYPIFFATMQEPSKNNSGDKIYGSENYVRNTIYTYETKNIYTNKKDKRQILKKEYDNLVDKKSYNQKIKTITTIKYRTDNNKELIIKDNFITKFRKLDLHKKWILKNSNFKKIDNQNNKTISIEEYLKLNKDEKLNMKKFLLLA
ncbi:N-6 DNA methylase [Campylobacter sp. LR264d]|nr:N-6 DNA methylase [Campylobacter sp. LR264d]